MTNNQIYNGLLSQKQFHFGSAVSAKSWENVDNVTLKVFDEKLYVGYEKFYFRGVFLVIFCSQHYVNGPGRPI